MCMNFQDLSLKWGSGNVCANFCENQSRIATVRVRTDGQTDAQTQTGFIMCPMLYRYAIAVGQIITVCVSSCILIVYCRYDKERQQFAVEIETVTTMLEAANKGKVSSVLLELTGSHPEMVGDMSHVTLNFDLSKIPFVLF